MTVYISKEDKEYFTNNGYSYDDVANTVNHYREMGLSDEDIQTRVDDRINSLKITTPNQKAMDEYGKSYAISEYHPIIENMRGAWDYITQVPYTTFKQQVNEIKSAELRTSMMTNRLIGIEASEEDKARLKELDEPFGKGRFNASNNYGITKNFVLDKDGNYFDKNSSALYGERLGNGIKQFYADVMKQTAILYDFAKHTTGGAGVGMVVGAVAGGLTARSPKGIVPGAKAGAQLVARSATAIRSFELEAGFMRKELEDVNADFEARGVEPLTEAEMDNLAMSVGLINAGLEFYGADAVLKTFPGYDKLLKSKFKEIVRDKAFLAQIRGARKNLLEAGIKEGSTEMLQETTNCMFKYFAHAMRNEESNFNWSQEFENIMYAGLLGATSSILAGGVGTLAKATTIKVKQGLPKKLAQKQAQNMSLDERLELIKDNHDTLMSSVDDMPSVQELEKTENIKNILKSQVQPAVDDDLYSDAAVDVFTEALAKLSKDADVSLDRLEEIASSIKVKTLSEEEAINQYNSDITLNGRVEENVVPKVDNQLNNKIAFREVYDIINEDKDLPSHDEAYKYSDMGYGFLRDVIEDKREADIRYESVKNNLKKHYDEKISKAKTEKKKNELKNEYNAKLSQAEQIYINTKKTLAEKIKNTYKEAFKTNVLNSVVRNQDELNYLSPEIKQNIQNTFGESVENLTEMVKGDIQNIIQENNLNEDEFKIKNIRMYGSYTTGKNKKGSDIDFLVEYTGSMREDDLFNMFNDAELEFVDKDGNQVKIDINPTKAEKSGTIAEHLENAKEYNKEKIESSAADYDYINHQVTGEKINLEMNPELENRKDEIVDVKELKDTKLNLLRTKENTPKLIENSIKEYLFSKNKTQTTVKNKNTDKNAIINASSVKEMINEVHNTKTDIDNKMEFRKVLYNIVANSKELFESAEYILSYNEAKSETLKDKQTVDKYANVVSTEFGDFITEFTVFNRKDIGTVKLYDLESYQKNRFSQPRQSADKSGMSLTESIISIANLRDFVKSKVVEKYNNDYKNLQKTNNKNFHAQPANDENYNADVTKYKDNNDRTLLMAHASKSERLDDILASGSLVAPSMSITKKGQKELSKKHFGNILLIRRPELIDYKKDNIFDRDIYSPRLPEPAYKTKSGAFVSSYDYDSMVRQNKRDPQKFEKIYGKTFEEYFDGAKKVIFNGYTPSGNRILSDYNSENLIKWYKKESLIGGESSHYGLSSFLAKLSSKLTSENELKKSAQNSLRDREEAEKEYNNLQKEYADLLFGDITQYYKFEGNSFQKISDEDFENIMFAIHNNDKKLLSEYIDTKNLPDELYAKLKDFTDRASKLPRSYFEAKPLREVSLTEFSYALVKKDTISDKQKAKLKDYGIKTVEYADEDNLSEALEKLDKQTKIYFQSDENYNADVTEEQIKNARGFTYQTKNFDGTVKDNIIVLLKNKADKSTLMHEFAHIYLDTLVMLAKESDKAKDILLTVNKWLRYDGVEYTTAQHEKFAKGFEAYIKSGKAPTYKLKRAFESFRKWLGDIYNSISLNGDLELDDETKKVFDTLLGDTSVDVQQKISDDIREKARNFANLKISKISDSGIIHPNILTDDQIRYRDTAYDIIFYALKHSKNEETRNYVQSVNQLRMILGAKKGAGLVKQYERLELLLSECEDSFSAHDGFLPEWAEFFNDPGVSYDNQIQGADAELALNALDVIKNEKYLRGEHYAEITDGDVQQAQYELDYILDLYKNAKEDKYKTEIISAFYDWIESIHPYIQDDMLNQWEQKTNEIDRYSALDIWQQAKEDLKITAEIMRHQGDYSRQFVEYANKILRRLDFLNESDKLKLFDRIQECTSFRDIERNLDDIMDIAQTLYDVSERRHLAEDIEREVKRTIHEWQNGIKKTKYTYPANKLFERLRAINNMNREEIEYLYDSQVNEELQPTYEADAVHDEDYYSTIEKMFIEFKYNGSYYNSTDFLIDLLNKIQNAKFTAKLARDEIDFERRMQQINLIDECAKAVDTHKNKVSKLEQLYRHGFNLNSALEMMFNKAIKEKFSLDYLYALKDGKVGQDRQNVLNKLAEIWGYTGKFKNEQLFNRFINMTKKEFDIKQRYTPDKVNGTYRITHTDKETGKTFTDRTLNLKNDMIRSEWEAEPIKLSRMEVLYYYIQAKNPISYKMLTDMGDETTPAKGQFDEKEFNDLLDNLTPKEKLMGDILQIAAEKYYDELNRYHIKKYHTELGRAEHYFPRKSEMQEVKPLELFNDYVQFNANQKFQKQRTAGPGVRIAPANPLAVLFDHMEKANTLIIMGEKLDLMNRVFKDSDLQRKLKAVWGDETTSEFMEHVTGNLYSGQQSVISEAESVIGGIMDNVIKAQIFFKPQVGLKQLLSFMNYGVGDDYVTPSEWFKAFAKQTFTPSEWKKNINYMLSIPYLKDRFTRGGSSDALKRQLEQRVFAKINLLDEKLSANVRYGDIGAIILGGKPYIDCLKNKGYSEDEAIKIFIEKTVNDQQSSIPSTLSNIQRNGGKHPLGKMFFAYQNTLWQYFRTAMNAIIRAKQNPQKKQVLNAIKLNGIYLYLLPLLFNMASSLSPLMAAGGDDDELKNDLVKSIIGGFTFIPIAGQLINAISTGFRGERASTGNWFDTASAKIGNIARKTIKGDVTPLDIFYASALFGEASTGVPIVTIGTEASGAVDIARGDYLKGGAKVMGYSDYRGKKLAGEI